MQGRRKSADCREQGSGRVAGEGGLAALQKGSRAGRSRECSLQRAETKEFRVKE